MFLNLNKNKKMEEIVLSKSADKFIKRLSKLSEKKQMSLIDSHPWDEEYSDKSLHIQVSSGILNCLFRGWEESVRPIVTGRVIIMQCQVKHQLDMKTLILT